MAVATALRPRRQTPLPQPPPSAPHPRRWLSCALAPHQPHIEEDESWKETAAEILRNFEPVVELVKDILHSGRYRFGGFISPDEQKMVEKLLSHHPRSEEKIGCGVDAIMVTMPV